jgi:hypothetical protein
MELESHKGYQLHLLHMASATIKLVMFLRMPQMHMQEWHYADMTGQLHAPATLAPAKQAPL